MAPSGRRSVTIEAPVMITSNKIAVWMDETWMHDFFDFLKHNKINICNSTRMHNVWIKICQQEKIENFLI